MEDKPFLFGEDEDIDTDDPEFDGLYTILVRSDEKEWKRKELKKKSRRIK